MDSEKHFTVSITAPSPITADELLHIINRALIIYYSDIEVSLEEE